MEIELKPGERLDELQRNGYRIIQDPGRFCFGMLCFCCAFLLCFCCILLYSVISYYTRIRSKYNA